MIPQILALISRIPIIPTLITCIPTLIPRIPIIPTLIPCTVTLIPHIPIIPTLIPWILLILLTPAFTALFTIPVFTDSP